MEREEIVWPLWVTDRDDPELEFSADNRQDLGQALEYWNCPIFAPYSDSWVVRDAHGRRVHGVVEHLQVIFLRLADDHEVPGTDL